MDAYDSASVAMRAVTVLTPRQLQHASPATMAYENTSGFGENGAAAETIGVVLEGGTSGGAPQHVDDDRGKTPSDPQQPDNVALIQRDWQHASDDANDARRPSPVQQSNASLAYTVVRLQQPWEAAVNTAAFGD